MKYRGRMSTVGGGGQYNFERRSGPISICEGKFNLQTHVGQLSTKAGRNYIEFEYDVPGITLQNPGAALARFSRILLQDKVPGIGNFVERKRLLHSIVPIEELPDEEHPG